MQDFNLLHAIWNWPTDLQSEVLAELLFTLLERSSLWLMTRILVLRKDVEGHDVKALVAVLKVVSLGEHIRNVQCTLGL